MEFKKKEKLWHELYPTEDVGAAACLDEICGELGLSPITGKLFYNRGCRTPGDVTSFLKNDMSYLHDPFLMRDMERAVARLRLAVEGHEKIAIYGDYDVDGVTSVTLLYLFLKAQGADVGYYIPSRDREGYGVSCAAVDRLHERGVRLIVTVDTGITANEEVLHAASLGIETVVTDHHECRAELPDACAVINPHRPDCEYPFKELAGVGVVFKLICAYQIGTCLRGGRPVIDGIREICREYADLVAIGTIADVMPIMDENRLIVTYGLRLLEETERPGLSALIREISDARGEGGSGSNQPRKKKKMTSSFIGYGLAPRINAAGRISTASKAVELLLAETDEAARALAEELCEINVRRQVEENRIAEQASKKIEQTCDLTHDHVIVLEDDNWQQGIIGIVASRITEKYGLPSVLISFDGTTRGYDSSDDLGKGSGRSVKGMNLVGALTECGDLLVRYGGHELAAGLSIRRGQIPEFRRRINEYAIATLGDEMPPISLDAECEVTMKDLTMPLMLEISRLEPFGVGNPVPNLILRGVLIQRVMPLGGGKHSKLIVSADGITMTAVWFGRSCAKLGFSQGDVVDLLFQLNINEYQNVRTLQMIVQDAHISGEYEAKCRTEIERYEEIRQGASFRPEDDYIPTRDDLGVVYKLLRSEFRNGHTTFSDRALLSLLQENEGSRINYVKMRYILRIFQELSICGVLEPDEGIFVFDIYYNPAKANIEKSSILRKLRSQCRTLN